MKSPLATLLPSDAREGKVLERIPVGAEPYGVVTDRAGKRAWVTLEYPGEVVEVDRILQAARCAREPKSAIRFFAEWH